MLLLVPAYMSEYIWTTKKLQDKAGWGYWAMFVIPLHCYCIFEFVPLWKLCLERDISLIANVIFFRFVSQEIDQRNSKCEASELSFSHSYEGNLEWIIAKKTLAEERSKTRMGRLLVSFPWRGQEELRGQHKTSTNRLSLSIYVNYICESKFRNIAILFPLY